MDDSEQDEDVDYDPYPYVPAPSDMPLGSVWPPIEEAGSLPVEVTRMWAVVWLPAHGWRYICMPSKEVEATPTEEEIPPQQPPPAKPI